MRSSLLAVALCLWAPVTSAQELMALLRKGPVVLVENDSKGKFDQATAVIFVEHSPERVWATVSDVAAYKEFLPRTVRSDVKPLTDTQLDVTFEVEVPGSNTVYTFRYDLDPTAYSAKGRWVKGDIKGSECEWKLVPHRGGTLVYYTAASRNYSSFAQSLEDDQQTVTIGVNVSAALATVRAVKARIEKEAR